MSDEHARPTAGTTHAPHALIDAELSRLAQSLLFRRSPRHVRFLRHLVACSLANDVARLREVALGVEVFLRRADRFDPRQDSIVRVEARRLRHKLARYYDTEGANARLRFRLPLGSYIVEIERQEAALPARASVAVFDVRVASDGDAGLGAWLSGELAALMARLNGLRVLRAGPWPDGGDAAARRLARERLAAEHLICAELGPLSLHLRVLRSHEAGELWSRQAPLPDGDAAPSPRTLTALQSLEPLARGVVAALHRDAAQRRLQRVQLTGRRPLVRSLAGGGPTLEGLDRLVLARLALRQHGLAQAQQAVHWCEEAVALMPEHGGAHALLAEALIASVGYNLLPPAPTLMAARIAAERAHALDPELPDPPGQLGYLRVIHQRDWPTAEARLREALQRAPAWAPAHARYGWALMMHRRFDEARACYAEARDLDPLSLLYRVHDALVTIYERDYERADAALGEVLVLAPQHLLATALRGALQLYRGRPDLALDTYRELQRRVPGHSIGWCVSAQALALQGQLAAAHAELQHLQQTHDAGQATPYEVAMVHARLGDPAAALHWLARSAERLDLNYLCVAVDPTFDTLRAAPGWADLLRRTGFAHLV